MLQSIKGRTRMAVAISSSLLILVAISSVGISSPRPRASWPKKLGVYISESSEAIPSFPRLLNGFRSQNGRDFWGRSFESTGSIRVFEGNGWDGIPDFPNTMNHCSDGIFMIRWRSANPDVRIATTIGYSADVTSGPTRIGSFGYMSGTNCEEPLFKFSGVRNNNESNLADIYYELKFWQAAP